MELVFNINHANSLELDWRETYLAMLDDLKPKYIRISATWSGSEKVRGVFNSTDVDWMMFEAGKRKSWSCLDCGTKGTALARVSCSCMDY